MSRLCMINVVNTTKTSHFILKINENIPGEYKQTSLPSGYFPTAAWLVLGNQILITVKS